MQVENYKVKGVGGGVRRESALDLHKCAESKRVGGGGRLGSEMSVAWAAGCAICCREKRGLPSRALGAFISPRGFKYEPERERATTTKKKERQEGEERNSLGGNHPPLHPPTHPPRGID